MNEYEVDGKTTRKFKAMYTIPFMIIVLTYYISNNLIINYFLL